MEDLGTVLNDCRASAKKGYRIAAENEKSLSRTLSAAKDKIGKTLDAFGNSACYSPETTELLEGQLSDIEQSFSELSYAFKEDLNNLRAELSNFSVTLFGRTMAGKSTLMEVLTEGDGASIGKGAQRTTRDIRKYEWNGLTVTDVPGIGAFNGEEDEMIAYEAAKTADIVLFLLTDDAPQPYEAECFSRIISMGKPVICIMNVKTTLPKNGSTKLLRLDMSRKTDPKRLEGIRGQFLSFSAQYGQSWEHIRFIHVHLKCAFAAQNTDDTELSELYRHLSNIDELRDALTEQVAKRGCFYRIKTFVDIISAPVLGTMENLLSQSGGSTEQRRVIAEKSRKLSDWKKRFVRKSSERIAALVTRLRGELCSAAAHFAEEHFSDKNAGKAWASLLGSRNIDGRCQDLLYDLEETVNDKIREISREITSELRFSSAFSEDRRIKADRVIDSKKIWNWSYITVSGGLSVAALVSFFVGATITGPLGLAAAGVGILGAVGSFFFKSREKKEREARSRLEKALTDSITEMCGDIKKQLDDALDKLISVRIDGLLNDMDNISEVLLSLADTQRKLARSLNKHILSMNRQITSEAMRLSGWEEYQTVIRAVARVPGNTTVIMLTDGSRLPDEQLNALHEMMSERIYTFYGTYDMKKLISRVLGKEIDGRRIRVDERSGTAYIPADDPPDNLYLRVRIAQQFSGMRITRQ